MEKAEITPQVPLIGWDRQMTRRMQNKLNPELLDCVCTWEGDKYFIAWVHNTYKKVLGYKFNAKSPM